MHSHSLDKADPFACSVIVFPPSVEGSGVLLFLLCKIQFRESASLISKTPSEGFTLHIQKKTPEY